MNYLGFNQWAKETFDEFWKKANEHHYDKIIIFGQNEWEYYHVPRWGELIDLCASRGQPLYIITAAHEAKNPFRNDNLKIDYWDTYWIGKTFEGIVRNDGGKKIDIDRPVKYTHHFISLNNRAHPHRCLLIDLLAKYDLMKHGAITMHQNSDTYQWQWWKYQKLTLPNDNFETTTQQYFITPSYYTSFMQIVSESADKGIIMSEKSATPLLVGKPFLVANTKGFHAFLKKRNFELYDEIFDYSFDEEPDEFKRYEMMLENVRRICKMPLEELNKLRKKITHKVRYNQELAYKYVFAEGLYPQIVKEIIQHYAQTGIEIDPWAIRTHFSTKRLKNVVW
jgi:hypothetical protein